MTQTLKFDHHFSDPKVHPFDQIQWDRRTASITDDRGATIFEQQDVEVPKGWSVLATNIVASKYFYGRPGTPERETSVKQLINRVAKTMADWGVEGGYFDRTNGQAFERELTWLLVNQYGAFNSPVWFNCGLYQQYQVGKDSGPGNFFWDPQTQRVERATTQYEHPQCSACFIQSVDDDMDSLMDLAKSEAMLFKFGSGSGTDLSTIRSQRERMSGGGSPSGPLSFLRVYDSVASVVKSGGKTRRAAKLNSLKDWHPDIKEFIEAKPHEERKAWALIDQGYSGDFNGEAYGSVSFQNENLSVRVTDEFMRAVEADADWTTHWVTDPSVEGPTYKARELMRLIAEGTWVCGDPGLQYEDTIQRWHTCADTEPINSSNPCVTGDTLVTTDKGPIRIDQLVGTQPMVMGLDGQFHQATRVIETGVKPLWEIRTQQGRTLRLTADHLVFETRSQTDIQASQLVAGEALVRTAEPERFGDDLVVSVKDLGVEELVYDLTEPTTNHFVANGILVHNCSEYMFLDNTACNLASLNLTKFSDEKGKLDTDSFQKAVDVFITAQEIVVDQSSYPTEVIAERSHIYRTLGLGFSNLGALIMSNGYSYDSEEGRALASAVTALLHNRAYVQSANISRVLGPCEGWEGNQESMTRVIQQHHDATQALPEINGVGKVAKAAKQAASECLAMSVGGYRNTQVTVLAPAGTISFLMDCDTTGIEPDIALVKYKLLAGGGMLKLVNKGVPAALKRLGYSAQDIERIVDYIEENDTIEGAPVLKDEHLSIFDCAFKPRNGVRSLSPMSHLKMMAAAQPFLSGAISKTCNMPQNSTVEDIMETYIEAWKMGLKAVAIYRDGSKRSQPMSTGKDEEKQEQKVELEPRRRRLPETRQSLTHKFEVGGHEGYLTVGLYPEGNPGEVFITMAKEGSTVGGMMDAFGTAISVGLQYGVPLQTLVNKFMHARFEPSGFTKNSEIPMAKSLVDYIFRWLAQTFPEQEELVKGQTAAQAVEKILPVKVEYGAEETEQDQRVDRQFDHLMADAPACDTCGSITVRNGSCYKCFNCGNSMGCS